MVDIDTQRDLFLPDYAACIRNHRRVLTNIRRIMAWARRKNIRMISTVLAGRNGSGGNSCIVGTPGQEKIRYTLRDKRTNFAADGCTDLPRDILVRYDQVILDKRSFDPFLEPRAERMLSELRADELIIIGAATEEAVKTTVLGLLARRKHVTLITDAIGSHDKASADKAVRQMAAKGAKLIETKAFCGGSSLNFVGICGCDRCRATAGKKMAHTAANN